MINRVKGWVLAATVLLCAQAGAASLSDIQVSNGDSQARITFSFMGDPEYAFSQIDSRSVALDIKQTGVIQGLPLQFSGNNLVKSIRSGTPKDAQSLRLVVDLTEKGKCHNHACRKTGKIYDCFQNRYGESISVGNGFYKEIVHLWVKISFEK